MYLIINVVCPEASNSTVMRKRREDGMRSIFSSPNLVHILNNDHGLTNGSAFMNQDWHLLVNRVGLDQQLTLAPKLLWNSYLTPSRFSAILTRTTNGLTVSPTTFTSSASLDAIVYKMMCLCLERGFIEGEFQGIEVSNEIMKPSYVIIMYELYHSNLGKQASLDILVDLFCRDYHLMLLFF